MIPQVIEFTPAELNSKTVGQAASGKEAPGQCASSQIVFSTEELLCTLEGKKLFLFDLDGTLADSEPLHWCAYNQLLSGQGIELQEKDINRYKGNPEFQIYEMIREDYGATIDDELFLKERLELYLNLVEERNLQPFSYVADLLQQFPKTPKAIVSSQRPEIIDALLDKWGMAEEFPKEWRVSCKAPYPQKRDIYENLQEFIPEAITLAFDREYEPQKVVVFEDSRHAIDAAQDVGMACVWVKS